MVSEEELDTIREECSLASELNKSLLKDMKQKYLEEEEEEEDLDIRADNYSQFHPRNSSNVLSIIVLRITITTV